jgi:hypothetical protein
LAFSGYKAREDERAQGEKNWRKTGEKLREEETHNRRKKAKKKQRDQKKK